MKNMNVKLFLLIILSVLSLQMIIIPQQKGIIKATVKEKQTIRDIAKEYLNDPDLWEEILKSNNLKLPTDIKTGMVLVIPSAQILKAKAAIDDANKEIQNATESGARTFASETVSKAIRTLDQSIKERKSGNWEKSYQLALEAKKEAVNAYQESMNKSTTGGEANLSYSKGKVEGKKPVESLWKGMVPPAKLLENDRVRTLSDSYAEVSFQDKSKIRLSENSQAVIQRNRVDLLNNRTEAKVSLEKGDAFALLTGGNQGKRKFNVEVPGLQTNIKSKSFWLNKEDKVTRIANYDGEIELKSKKSQVTLKSNQGSSLLATGTLTQPKELLSAPRLIAPATDKVIYANTITIEWSRVEKASKYWVVVARDAAFKSVVFQSKSVASLTKEITLERGTYYWRVASIDGDGFPGSFSERNVFSLISSNEPPYMSISEPIDGTFTTEDVVVVKGQTEALVKVLVNGSQIKLDSSSSFEVPVNLVNGKNVITVEAIDSSKNKSTIKRTVQYSKGGEAFLQFDPDMFKSADKKLYIVESVVTIKGTTIANAMVSAKVEPNGLTFKTVADSAGTFHLNISGITKDVQLTVTSVTKEGKSAKENLSIVRDAELPAILFGQSIPSITSDENPIISGSTEYCNSLRVNGAILDIKDGKFEAPVKLKEGNNVLLFIGTNVHGNSTKIQREIILDSKPPELVDQKVITGKTKGSGVVKFEVKAKDATTLKKTAKIVYQCGEDLFTEYLKLDELTNTYRGSVNGFENNTNEIKIKLILLEDQMGNSKEYNFFN